MRPHRFVPRHLKQCRDDNGYSEYHDWYMQEHGGGVMILEGKVFWRLCIPDPVKYEDLELMGRLCRRA